MVHGQLVTAGKHCWRGVCAPGPPVVPRSDGKPSVRTLDLRRRSFGKMGPFNFVPGSVVVPQRGFGTGPSGAAVLCSTQAPDQRVLAIDHQC